MNTLNLGSDDEPAVKKKSNTRYLKIALGLAAVILIPTIGSTLAGSIAINTGSGVEFGQGIAATAACGDITLTPTSVFTNGSPGAFTLDTVTVSVIPSTCSGKTFTIKAYDSVTATSLTLSSRTGSALIVTPTMTANACTVVVLSSSPAGNETATCTASASSVGAVVIRVASRPTAADVYKFTVESS